MRSQDGIDTSGRVVPASGGQVATAGGDEAADPERAIDVASRAHRAALEELFPGARGRDALRRLDALWDELAEARGEARAPRPRRSPAAGALRTRTCRARAAAAREARHRATVAALEARVAALEADLARARRPAPASPGPDRADLLATVVHDLRGPLGNVMMAASALAPAAPDAAPVDPDADARRVRVTAERIQRSARRMAQMISDLVELDRLRTGQIVLHVTAADAGALLERACADAGAAAAARGIRIAVEAGPDLPRVRCDRARTVAALTTLVSTAIAVTPPDGTIVVGAGARGCEVELAVTDAGPGIPEAERPHVFERDWRSATPAYRGAALGLAIVRGTIEGAGGEVRVEAAAAGGARFVVALPIDADATARARS